MTSPLLAPLALRPGVVSRNRVWLAPLTNQQSHADGTLSDAELHFLARRADGGFGLVETCAAYVSQDGKAWPGELGVHDDAMLDGLTRLARRIHDGGALASAQLFHGGVRASQAVSGLPTWSASANADDHGGTSREATEDDLARVIADFVAAARRCADAGFDSVELHGAHGYLLSQFLSTTYNRREDRWGGSLEHRARLIREVTRAVKAAAPSLVLAVRMSPEDFGQTKGVDLDESLQVARWLVEDGAELLHLSLWRAARNTTKRPEAHATTLFREAVGPSIPLVVAGAIWTHAEAEAQLALGADAVALGRSAIANHDWPAKADDATLHLAPVAPATLIAEGASPGFVEYLRAFRGFVG
ncbi:MAG: oxidoreductase [Myxococcaceae bacterium]|nr:oxidoreductase [Myxococcaceae bacterium]